VLRRAEEFASEAGLCVAVVVVDSAGHPVAAERMDGAPFPVLAVAQEKAWTAAAFGTPTATWRESSQPGAAYWGMTNSLGGRFSVLTGGAPLMADGRVIGGVGVSGGDDTQDHSCALHAATDPEA
jgi:uncharacterized protein GlcG (DUF336 family)